MIVSDPEPKDAIIAVLGAAGALAGLLLVFSGFIFAQAASFPSDTDDKIVGRYTRAARLAIYPFVGFLVVILMSLWWLLHPEPHVFIACVWAFIALVIATAAYGIVMAYRYL